MRRHLALALLAPMICAVAPAKDPDFVSPEINGNQVIFRCFAPKAQAVAVQGLRGRKALPMTKDAAGIWSLALSDFVPDLYTYSFDVDGATVLDSHNRGTKKWITTESAFEFPAGATQVWSLQSVPHGVVHRHTYSSKAAQRENAYQVYTPPGYDPRGTTKYPVVFLFHGYGDDETAWIESGRAPYIADNLLAKNLCKPAVIVMTNGHPVPISRQPNYWMSNNAAMEQVVVKEVLPQVEAQYNLSREAADRAIVGLSMGGGHALEIGLSHPELFQWVGAFSAAAPEGDNAQRFSQLLRSASEKRKSPQLLWIGIGKDDFLMKRNEAFTAWLKEKNVPFTWYVTEGGHEWPLWRAYLAEFLQKIYR